MRNQSPATRNPGEGEHFRRVGYSLSRGTYLSGNSHWEMTYHVQNLCSGLESPSTVHRAVKLPELGDPILDPMLDGFRSSHIQRSYKNLYFQGFAWLDRW
jgi:hypothetical protein